MKSLILFPHQLFEEVFANFEGFKIYLVEHPLFFTQYRFHKKKLILHRASMSAFAEKALSEGFEVTHCKINAFPDLASVSKLLREEGTKELTLYDPTDDWLNKDIEKTFHTAFTYTKCPTPMFLTDKPTLDAFFKPQGERRMRLMAQP